MNEIRLRDAEATDLETLYEFEQDADAARQVNFPIRSRERFMTHWRDKILAVPDCIAKTVLVDDEIAGSALSWNADGEQMIGYWFGRKFWGRGIGTAAVRAFVADIEHRPLYADPSLANPGSVRLLEKCGFKRVGIVMAPNHYGEGEIEHVMLKLD